MWQRVRRFFRPLQPLSKSEFEEQKRSLLEQTPIPIFWLYGKTGSGKTSLIKALTGANDAEIGNGFRPQTKFSSRYAFPSEESRLLDFLDTRGLGEAGYDAVADLKEFDEQAHLMIVTVRVTDQALETLLVPLRQLRRQNPQRPVLLVLTCLHETYPGEQHPDPDPFHNHYRVEGTTAEDSPELPKEPVPIKQALQPAEIAPRTSEAIGRQIERFGDLVDAITLADLTREEDGFLELNFGLDRIREALLVLLPDAYRQTFITWQEVANSLRGLHEERAFPHILSSALLAATAASVPVPWIDLPIVAAVQLDLVRRLAGVYGRSVDAQEFLTAAGLVGGPLALRQGIRELLKFIPWVGIPANAALGFGSTFGLGKAYCWYYGERLKGYAPSRDEIRTVLDEQMNLAKDLWAKRQGDTD